MKLVTYIRPAGGPPRVGAIDSRLEAVIDLAAAAERFEQPTGAFTDMLTLLEQGPAALEEARNILERAERDAPAGLMDELSTVTLLAPVPRPRSIRDCLAFEGHLIQAMRTVAGWKFPPLAWIDRGLARVLGRGCLRPPRVWYERPIYYKGNPASVVGADADIEWPSFTDRLDFELEFGVFIGRRGKNIPVSDAASYIAGFTIFNDFSARDLQLREMQGRLGPAKSKDFDTGNAIGPWLVTRDEVHRPYGLEMIARVNGEEWSRGNSGRMHFSFEEIIAAVSEAETLHPGDFIGSGTVPGGCGLELDRWISPGDVIELEVSGLGILRNRIVRAKQPAG
ncbi:MAG: fumarylacetoacetate hydrolase family protein [Planctomycetota bacterium]|nr:MAG: fumarylacetoacetate hydrolase family protein [Planctomycetota bacterium]REK25424.1 MAG: fumarylacetoacetate hydrolase family protein [Planctomycetota bacterium]REK38160.1 MAG: fumarylacetoacetate hydrolase family protein [Planctomycetota bacterium]